MNIVMTIAGSDSSGGAGIQADIKTFQELGVYGTSAITALTAQNTLGVEWVLPAPADFVNQQIEVVFQDLAVKVVKTGMLFSEQIIDEVVKCLCNKDVLLVVDPVMVAKGGTSLLQDKAVEALTTKLLPLATVLTPNIKEAEVISGIEIKSEMDIQKVAAKILAMGVKCVVMKGGHLDEEATATDSVYFADGTRFKMESVRIETKHTHGTGCTYSAALTAFLGLGWSLKEAIIEAKKFVQLAIENPLNIGHGHGPTNHFAYKLAQGVCEVNIIESS